MSGKLPGVVFALGFVSLFTDIASEMVYPLLPRLMVGLGAGAWWLGAIEGVGDATAAVLKLFSGKLADRVQRRKPLLLWGYGLSNLARPLIALAVAPWQVVGVRFIDRIGKGLRSSPRDALLAASVPREQAGAAFGFHRAMDNVGAAVGPLLAWLGLRLFNDDPHRVLLATIVPGALAVAIIGLFVRDLAPPEADPRPAAHEPSAASQRAPSVLRGYLLILGVFAIVNTSDLFLLKRLGELGATTSQQAIFWSVLNAVRALSGYPGGLLSDRIGRARCMMLGWALYALSYGAMAAAPSLDQFVVGFLAYGLFYGFTEGAERAIVASLAPRDVLGGAFGRFHLITGLARLPSNILFGLAWDAWGGPGCLLASGLGALLALLALALWARRVSPG